MRAHDPDHAPGARRERGVLEGMAVAAAIVIGDWQDGNVSESSDLVWKFGARNVRRAGLYGQAV